MNKDVIYIEPENDITDIIDKVKTSKTKLVALVPPKKSAVLGSIVNFKLLARASRAAGKDLVLITTDSSLLKLAGLANIPAAKNLQDHPELPLIVKDGTDLPDDGTVDATEANQLADKAKRDLPEHPTEAEAIEDIEIVETAADTEADTDQDLATTSEDAPKQDKKLKKKSPIPNLDKYRKWIIIGASALVLVVGFLVWALVFAPSVKISVALRTVGQNFSSAVSFVSDENDEDVKQGIFALESAEITTEAKSDFTATGEANRGERASGTISAYYTFTSSSMSPIPIATGTTFTRGDFTYTVSEAATISPDLNSCENNVQENLTCRITIKVKVIADEPGVKYDTAAADAWKSSNPNLRISAAAIAGGTDKMVKIVSQKDFDTAREKLASGGDSAGRTKLLEKFPDSTFPLDASYKVEPKDPVSSPKVGEEVPEGTTPQIAAETVYFMYGVDREKINQFIKDKVGLTLGDDQKIYSTGVSSDPDQNKARLENYKAESDTITAKLTSYAVQVGPAISDAEILDLVKGRKIGEVRSILEPLVGSSAVEVTESVFWVSSVPNDSNKIEIVISIEE